MKNPLFLIAFFWISTSYADEMPHPELRNLFEADLVVDANFKSQSQTHFYIIVNESIKGAHYGIKKGDQIKLFREDNGCGMTVDYSFFKRNRYYLRKVPNGWMLNYSSTQSIKSVYQFISIQMNDSQCGLSYVQPHGKKMETMNVNIREFVKTYQFDTIKYVYTPTIDSLALLTRSKSNKIIAAFEKNGRRSIPGGIDEEMEPMGDFMPLGSSTELPVLACELMAQRAKHPYSMEKMRAFMVENENPLVEMGIEGKVYVKLLLNETGEVSEVKLLRGVHPILDSLALKKAVSLPPWKAAEDRYGNKRKCYTNLLFHYKIISD